MVNLKLNLGSQEVIKKVNNDIQEFFYKKSRTIEECLIWATEHDASDIYIKVFERPYVSRYGKITQLPCSPITKDMWAKFYSLYVLNELNASYVRNKLLDISINVRIPENSKNFGIYETNYYRYRVSLGFSDSKNVATFRMIRPEKPTFDTINYPEQCKNALFDAFSQPTGINFMTGVTGSGKSTTLAACINSFTKKDNILDNKVIITLEDPVENTFNSTESVKIVQKELFVDFKSYELGIKASLREHPNIIIVGECRDKEVICAAIEAARTGHLVSTSFHAGNVSGTISRLLYHLDNDKNLAYDLIINLNIIMGQTLIKSDNAYIVDTQYMLFNKEITERLLDIVNKDENIAVEVSKLINNKNLLEQGIVKDWTHKKGGNYV